MCLLMVVSFLKSIVDAITEVLAPTAATHLALLGMTAYYMCFLSLYTSVTATLRLLP